MDATDPFYRQLVNLYDSVDQALRAAEMHEARDTRSLLLKISVDAERLAKAATPEKGFRRERLFR